MASKVALATITIQNLDGNPKDEVRNSVTIAFDDSTAGFGDVAAALQDLYNASTFAHQNIGHYLATCLAAQADIRVYDITTHLDGSPHGSPVFELPAAAITNSGINSKGNQVAATIAYHADLSAVPEQGPVGAIPTPERGIDWGAPATHTGITKPRASRRGRIYIGPLDNSRIDVDGNNNAKLSTTSATNLAGLMHDWAGAGGDLAGRNLALVVWSRKLAAVHVVTGGWVDTELTTVRRRQFVPALRETWAV